MAMQRFETKDNGKRIALAALFSVSALIVALGLAFGVYSWVYHVNYAIMSLQVPGYVFAAVIVFLGVRYFLSVIKMRRRLMETSSGFKWGNFRPEKSKTKKMEG
jgi:hypothetical protein